MLAGMGALAGCAQSGPLKLPPTTPAAAPPEAAAKVDRILTSINPASTWGRPDLFGEFSGLRLYSEGHYKAAIKYFKHGARYADKPSQLYIGLMYANGRGVMQDPVTACAWLALAAQRKYPGFVATRDRVCNALTPEQHDEAVAVLDKLLPVYGDKVAKRRVALAMRLDKMQTTGSRLGFDSGIQNAPLSLIESKGERVLNANCAARSTSIAGIPLAIAGCAHPDLWDPKYWNPEQYFALRGAPWNGTVTVGLRNKKARRRRTQPSPGQHNRHRLPAQTIERACMTVGHGAPTVILRTHRHRGMVTADCRHPYTLA